MKFTLIGGAGFIGQELANHFDKAGHEVVVIDSFTYGQSKNFSSTIEVIEDDILNITRHTAHLNTSDFIFYMASPRLNEINDLPQPLPHIEGLKKTLDICENNTAKVVFFSSCSVYGYRKNLVNEQSPTRVTSLYSKLKIDSENLLKRYDNLRYKIVRLSTLYGISKVSRNDLLINNFVKDILFSKYLEVYDPLAWRPNIDIRTLTEVLLKLSEEDKFTDVLNIGFNKLNITKQDLILTLVTQNKLDFTVKYYSPDDSRSYKVDFSQLENLINVDVQQYVDGINVLIQDFKNNVNA